MVVAKGYLTLEEFLRLPERKPALEYEDGRVTQKVSPQFQHSAIQRGLIASIDAFGRPRRLAATFPELRVTYSGRSLVPDVAVLRWERIPRNEAGEVANVQMSQPDIAIEITSPDQSARSLIGKCERYVAHSVPIAVLVDVERRTVRLFKPGQPARVLRGADRIDLDEVLPGFELTVDQVFASLRFD